MLCPWHRMSMVRAQLPVRLDRWASSASPASRSPRPTSLADPSRGVSRGDAGLRVEVHALKADLIRWSLVFWLPVVLALLGLYAKG